MAVAFVLNGEAVREAEAAPSMTVLDWLRTRRRLTGTKEGCAEGDCGACTIAIGRPEGERVRWQAANSCIMLLSQIDGMLVKTVEGLADRAGLHPVQTVLAESDGTQCGFCTPGIVMSLYALTEGRSLEGSSSAPPAAADDEIHEALAGNLCRCTGYRPIVDAARALCAAPPVAAVEPAAPAPSPRMAAQGELHLSPQTLGEAVALRAAHPEATLLAGATDLGLIPAKKRRGFPLVISMSRVAELKRISWEGSVLVLGAAVTYADGLDAVEGAFPAFGALVRRIGSRQIRTMGTFGGNLGTASPVGDTLPVLLALDAEVDLAGPAGMRRMAVSDFLTGYRRTALAPGEVIAAVRLPRLADGEQLFAWKLSRRFDQDISTLLGAFRLRVQDGALVSLAAAFGGMADRAKRAPALEAALLGAGWGAGGGEACPEGIEAALEADFAPLSDHRASAAYRRAAAANLVRRLHLATTRPDIPLELAAL